MLKRSGEILQHWATKLEVPEELWQESGIHMIRGSKVIASDRVVAYRTQKTTIILLPDQIDRRIEGELESVLPTARAGGELPKLLTLRHRWRDFIYYRDTPVDIPVNITDMPPQIRPLTDLDKESLDQLKSACSEREIQSAQIDINDPLIQGYFEEDRLVGTASLLYEGHVIADVGVLVHPLFRRQGIAVAIVQIVANLGLVQGRIIQYMSAESNHGSVHTAQRSGFELFLFEDGFELL